MVHSQNQGLPGVRGLPGGGGGVGGGGGGEFWDKWRVVQEIAEFRSGQMQLLGAKVHPKRRT